MQFSIGGGGQPCPPNPPPSPQHQPQQQQQQQLDIANLLQFAQSSYATNPTDALSALMNALDLTTGTDDASRRAIDRIRSELGETVADRVIAGKGRVDDTGEEETVIHRRGQRDRQQPSCCSTVPSISNECQQKMTEKEMTLRAIELVQQMLNDESTFLHSQGREHILQQAMEDGSSIICSNCGDMISRERWRQHAEHWCREFKSIDSNDDGDGMET